MLHDQSKYISLSSISKRISHIIFYLFGITNFLSLVAAPKCANLFYPSIYPYKNYSGHHIKFRINWLIIIFTIYTSLNIIITLTCVFPTFQPQSSGHLLSFVVVGNLRGV